jgi:hypothetical protein
MIYLVVWQIGINILEEYTASIFKVYPENGKSRFLPNIVTYPQDLKTLNPLRP